MSRRSPFEFRLQHLVDACREIEGRAEPHDLRPQVEALVVLSDIAERLQRDQAAPGGGRAQAYAPGNLAERHFGMLGVEALQDREALGQRLDELAGRAALLIGVKHRSHSLPSPVSTSAVRKDRSNSQLRRPTGSLSSQAMRRP
jgi:hypothetical protein